MEILFAENNRSSSNKSEGNTSSLTLQTLTSLETDCSDYIIVGKKNACVIVLPEFSAV